jgi:hypothetical protein
MVVERGRKLQGIGPRYLLLLLSLLIIQLLLVLYTR